MKIAEFIQQPEGRTIEFKESLPKKSDLNKTIVAFSNDAGGITRKRMIPRTIIPLHGRLRTIATDYEQLDIDEKKDSYLSTG